MIGDALRGLPLPPVRMHVNNRKLSQGFYQGIGLADPAEALRIVDKLDKIGPAAVAEALVGHRARPRPRPRRAWRWPTSAPRTPPSPTRSVRSG